MLNFFAAWFLGVCSLLGYMCWRIMRTGDDSNLTNPVRALAHVLMHPEDLLKMFYVRYVPKKKAFMAGYRTAHDDMSVPYLDGDEECGALSFNETSCSKEADGFEIIGRPFWYLDKDEITDVVQTRPPKDAYNGDF